MIQLDKQRPPTFHHLISVATEFINIRRIHKIAPQVLVTHHIKWYPPTLPFIKLNIDEAFSRSNMHGGEEGVFRDYTRNWLMGFSHRVFFIVSQAIKLNLWLSKRD